MTTNQDALRIAVEIIDMCLEWIDAVPSDTVLPTMPGFDRDWVDRKLENLRPLSSQTEQAEQTAQEPMRVIDITDEELESDPVAISALVKLFKANKLPPQKPAAAVVKENLTTVDNQAETDERELPPLPCPDLSMPLHGKPSVNLYAEDTVRALIRAAVEQALAQQAKRDLEQRAIGRGEALEILLEISAEGGLDEYTATYPIAETGDSGCEWDCDKLRELFRIDDAVWSKMQEFKYEFMQEIRAQQVPVVDEREAFESVMRTKHPTFPLTRQSARDGKEKYIVYQSAGAQHMWNGWTLRAALAQSPARMETAADDFNLPEKIVVGVHAFSKEYAEGWNDCIDEYAAASTAQPAVPDGHVIVPVEPTQEMIIAGFESVPDRAFDGESYPEEYDSMSGCQQAAFRAKRCWEAMISAASSQKE